MSVTATVAKAGASLLAAAIAVGMHHGPDPHESSLFDVRDHGSPGAAQVERAEQASTESVARAHPAILTEPSPPRIHLRVCRIGPGPYPLALTLRKRTTLPAIAEALGADGVHAGPALIPQEPASTLRRDLLGTVPSDAKPQAAEC